MLTIKTPDINDLHHHVHHQQNHQQINYRQLSSSLPSSNLEQLDTTSSLLTSNNHHQQQQTRSSLILTDHHSSITMAIATQITSTSQQQQQQPPMQQPQLPQLQSMIQSQQQQQTQLQTQQHLQMQTQQTQQQKHIDNIDRMIGIIFVQETFINNYDNSRLIYPNEICLGTIILSKYNHLIYANSLRKLIKQESIFQMDDNFVFLSPFGCIISQEQESQILICYLITEKNTIQLRRKPKQNCFSLIGFYSSTSNSNQSLPLTSTAIFIDYIYANYYLDLKQLRTIIDEKLEDMKPVNRLKLSNQTYYFRKSSGLIINPINESNIHLIEIINYSNIMIEFERSSLPLSIQDFTDQRNLIAFNQDRSVKKFIEDIPPSSTTTTALTTTTKTNNNNNSNNHNIEGRSDSISIKNRPSRSIYRRKTTKKRIKQIMISYVRHEAADHALQLKKSLLECGFSVYLDVHEIQMGSDWQDSLNSAVQNCNYFVPLITQNYGRTQWTNREIKLADIKQKHIIPINFLDLWPPECLAIQFATTQYISWNPHSDSNEPNNRYDGKTWPIEEIWEVTNLIKERINKLSLRVTSTTINEDLPSIQQQDNKNHYQSQQQQQQQQSEQQQQQTTTRKLIVISSHPEQQQESARIKSILSDKYDVWCSNDFKDLVGTKIMNNNHPNNQPSSSSSSSTSFKNRFDQDLTTISEENSTLTRSTQDYARHIAESCKQRPKSVPNPDRLTINKKKELSRVFSCGETTHHSSFSADKLDHLQCFQKKVSQSSLVIILSSKKYFNSKTSEEHVYYCGQRFKAIHVQYDDSPSPVWFTKLISHEKLKYKSPTFENDLLNRISRTLDPDCKEIKYDDQIINCLADMMKKNMPDQETCVFVFGSTNTDNLDPRTNQICKEIGKELAKLVKNINIITNGTYGAGDIVAHTFYEECRSSQKSTGSVVHIIPQRQDDDQDITPEKVSYGQTIFLGQSTKQRDSVIARMLDTALLIGGDKDAAREIEEFIWNDHFVIPIKSTGGAAGGEFEVPQKMFNCPIGVDEKNWQILSETNATPREVAKAVVNIIFQLKKAIYEHASSRQNIIIDNNNLVEKQNKSSLTNDHRQIKRRLANRKKLNTGSVNSNNVSKTELNHNHQYFNHNGQTTTLRSTTSSSTIATIEQQRSLPLWSKSISSEDSSNLSNSDSGDLNGNNSGIDNIDGNIVHLLNNNNNDNNTMNRLRKFFHRILFRKKERSSI